MATDSFTSTFWTPNATVSAYVSAGDPDRDPKGSPVGTAVADGGGTVTFDSLPTQAKLYLTDGLAHRYTFLPAPASTTTVVGSGGTTVTESDLDPVLLAKINSRLPGGRVARPTPGATQTVTLTAADDQGQVDVFVSLTTNTTLVVAGVSTVTRCTIRVTATQDATGGRTFSIKEAASGNTVAINAVTTASASTFVYCFTDDSATLVVAGTGVPTTTTTTSGAAFANPTISGTAGVGNVLTAVPPSNLANVTYQWTRDGVDIPGATSQTYTYQTADLNTIVKVRITGDPVLTSTSSVASGTLFGGVSTPWISAHRGGGASMAPEAAPEAFNWVLNKADGTATNLAHIFLDADMQTTSDGVLVINHDATVDRTTTSTGNVSSFTAAQFTALTIDPAGNTDFPLGGWANDHPITFDQLLDIVGPGSQPLLTEAKTSSHIDAASTSINAKGLLGRVILAVDDLTLVSNVKAKGVSCMFTSLSANGEQAAVLSAAPDHFAYAATNPARYTDAWLTANQNAGIKNWYYTLRRRVDHATQMARPGVVGGASDDPFYMLKQNVIENSLDLSNGRYHHGMIESSATKQAGKRPTISGSKIVFTTPNNASSWMLLGSLADESQGPPTRITFTVTWDALGTDTARWFAFIFGCTDDSSFYFDTANADNQGTGYICGMRQTGQMLISRQNAGAAATSLAAPAAANPVTVAGTSINFQIDYNKTTHVTTLTRLDTNAVATGTADATYQGAYMHCGTNSQSTGQHVSFSNIAVVR